MNKLYISIVILLVTAITFFFIGRSTHAKKIEYVKGDTIHDSIPYEKLVPYKEIVPADPAYIYTTDTLRDTIPGKGSVIIITQKVDTAKILEDWTKERIYNQTLFNNKKEGSCIVDLYVQYNKVQGINYEFTPIQKVITKENIFIPFVSIGYNSFGFGRFGAGTFINKIGIDGGYLTNFNGINGWELGLKYRL
jgi:hypothetical protein